MPSKVSSLSTFVITCIVVGMVSCSGMPNGTASGSNAGDTGSGNPGSTRPSGAEILYEAFTSLDITSTGIRAFNVNASNGTLNLLPGFPVSGPFHAITTDPAGRLLFNSHASDGGTHIDITAFRINGSSGSLTQSADNPGNSPNLLGPVFHPNGKFLYLLDGFQDVIFGYAFDSSGKFSPLPGSPYAVGIPADSIDIDPHGRFLYAGSSPRDNVMGFSIDQATGALIMLPGMPTQVRSFTPCDCPIKAFTGIALRFGSSGQLLFIADAGNGVMTSWAVDQNTGALTKAGTAPDEKHATNMVVTPNDKFLYDAGSTNGIHGFVVGPGGTLAPMPAAFPVPTGFETFIVIRLMIDPSGRFLYQINNSGRFSGYIIDQNTGNLAANGQVFSDTAPNSITIIR